MNMKFNEESTKRIVEGYYKKYEDFDCNLEIKCGFYSCGPVGRSLVPVKTSYLTFTLEGNLCVNGNQETVRTKITDTDVTKAFKTMLEADGYTVSHIRFDYDKDEQDDKTGTFNGVCVEMSTKKKVK